MTGLSIIRLRRLHKEGKLRAYRPGGPGGRLMFSAHDLNEFIASTADDAS